MISTPTAATKRPEPPPIAAPSIAPTGAREWRASSRVRVDWTAKATSSAK